MTICPYKIVMIGVTVVLGMLVAYGQIHNDEEEEQRKKAAEALAYMKKFDGDENGESSEEESEENEKGRREEKLLLAKLAVNQTTKDERWGDMVAAYLNGLHTSAKAAHPRAYRAAYLTMISLLVLFHFEIFSGGAVCRYIFHNASAAENASVAAADVAMGMSPGEVPPVGA